METKSISHTKTTNKFAVDVPNPTYATVSIAAKEIVKSSTDFLNASALQLVTRAPSVLIYVLKTRVTLENVYEQLVRCPGTLVNVRMVLQVCFASFLTVSSIWKVISYLEKYLSKTEIL